MRNRNTSYFCCVMKEHKQTILSWKVYLIKCCDNSIYTGCTSNLPERIKRHEWGEVHYTQTRLPVKLITYICFTDKYKAYQFEKYLKSGSGKAFSQKRFL
jgi:putative endonuclease